jgi:hypothetical protein
MLAAILTSCLYVSEEPNSPAYYAEEVVYVSCMYDPLPYDYPMRYCDTYLDTEHCFWEEQGVGWECVHEWRFYWDTCSWEYVDSQCTW